MIGLLKIIAPYLIYVVGFIVIFMCLTGRAQYGLFMMAPLLPLHNIVVKMHELPMGKDINDIIFLSMIIGWLVGKASRQEKLFQSSPFNALLFAYFIFTFFSLYWGSMNLHEPPPINPLDERVQRWKNYMILPLLFFLSANNLNDMKDFKRIFIAICLGMLLMNYYNVQQIQDMTSWVSRAKVHGTFVDLGANEVAAFYATYTFVLLGVWRFMAKGKWRNGLFVLIFFNFFIMLFMYSRAAYLAFLAAGLFFAVLKFRIILIPLILVPIFWKAVLPTKVIERVTFTEREGHLDESANVRLLLWEQSLNYFKESPIFGIGFNVFSRIGMKRDTHNLYLRTLAEQGLIGIAFLLIVLWVAFQRGWRLYQLTEDPFLKGLGLGFCACVIAVSIGNFFGDRWTPLQLASHFWIFLGMVERANNMIAPPKTATIASPAFVRGRRK